MDQLFTRLGVQPGEQRLFGWALGCLALLGAAAFALLNTAETLFLKRIGVDFLPVLLLASSALLVATTGFAGRGLAASDRRRGLPRLFLLLGGLVAPFSPLVALDVPGASAALVLAARQLLPLGLLGFWMALGDLVSARQAKRLFAPLSAGLTVGGIVGSFASAPLARVIGVAGMPALCATLLVAAAFAAQRFYACQPRRIEAGLDPRAVRTVEPSRVGFREVWAESRLFRLLLVSLLCSGLLGPVLYFEFSYLADRATGGPGGEQALLSLYAQFRGWLNVANLVAQLWLSSRLYRRLGLPLSLALWPIVYLGSFGWLSVDLVLVAGVAGLGAARVAEDGVAGAALRVIFNLFPERLRSRAAGLLEGPVNRLGGVLGNGLVMTALPLGLAPWIPLAATPVAAIWLAAALVLRRAYPSLLLQASAERSLSLTAAEREQLLDPATVRALGQHLADPDARNCTAAIDLLAEEDPRLAVELLAGALLEAGPETRGLLIDALQRRVERLPVGTLRSRSALEALDQLLADRDALALEQRAALVQVYARLSGGDSIEGEWSRASQPTLRRALGDRGAPVRLAAIAELHRRGTPPPGVADLDTVLSESLAGPDAVMRRTARAELRAMLLRSEPDAAWERSLALLASRLEQRADRVETAEALVAVADRHDGAVAPCAEAMLRWGDDRDPRVRAAVWRFAGHANLPAEATRMARALGSRDTAEETAAREALLALGPDAVEAMLVEYEFGAPAQREVLAEVLSELEIDATTLEQLYRRQLEAARQALVLRGALEGERKARLLRARLEERVEEGLGALIALLGVLHDDPRVLELERRLRRSRDPRRRDVVVEGLEALLSAQERREVEPLLESGAWEERGARAAEALGRSRPSSRQAWGELRRDDDELTRQLAAYSSPLEADPAIRDAHAVRPLDLAVRLQDVPVFDRLSTRQLVRVAEAMQLEERDDGEEIFAEGDEGAELFVVLEGEVDLLKGGEVFGQVPAGRFFGELSAIDGVPRSAGARARGSARLARLDREDLLGLMEEVPTLGVALSQLLAQLVRELREELGGSP